MINKSDVPYVCIRQEYPVLYTPLYLPSDGYRNDKMTQQMVTFK